MADSDKQLPSSDDAALPLSREGETPLSRDGETPAETPTLGPTLASGSPETAKTAVPNSSEEYPQFDGYEILEELGRGGMGVVYKARSVTLDRLVALKMIIGGKFANEEDVQRFRIEAESAARLDHPGIIPIYEVGESGGNHFFTMKLVDGKSLALDKDAFQGDSRKAVELMIAIAHAVVHAHQRGVLHRDLKPANILIDGDGRSLVTDLGLAKRMEDDSGLTQTGMAMGTPGFMAPEQAQGRRDITTAADIFSLGAILFWLQTGQPPFQRETAMQTLMATIQDEVPSTRSISPGADHDLDLICGKAMHRDPAQRYATAAAFARDLQAWLDGDLISVRAPTAIDVASVWVKKNLRTLFGATISGIACGLVVGLLCNLDAWRQVTHNEHSLAQMGHGDASWVAVFDFFRHLGGGWQILQFLIVPAVAICAVLNVILLRPQNREQNLIAAVTTGLVAGVIAFLTGLGWEPLKHASVASGSQDIALLASAVWLESDAERELAQQALLQRYPGLEEMSLSSRQDLVFAKIQHDQAVGILPGIWAGMIGTVLFVVAPLMATNLLSGISWIAGDRGGYWLACTLERCLYCVIFFTIVVMAIFPVPPAWYLVLPSLALMAMGLWFALKSESWLLRIAFSVSTFFVMLVLNVDMVRVRSAPSAAGLARTDEEFRVHAQRMNRLVRKTHDPFVHYQAGIGWLSIGEEAEYIAHCRYLQDSFENAFRPQIAGRLAKVSLLRPDLQDKSDLATFGKLAEFASSFESSPLCHWFFLTRAMAEQRSGNPQAALEWTPRVRENENGNGYMLAGSYAVDALAHLDLGDVEAARASLALGRAKRDRMREKSFSDGHDREWVDWRVFVILEQEIESRLAEAATGQH